jgi:hypothetical protein
MKIMKITLMKLGLFSWSLAAAFFCAFLQGSSVSAATYYLSPTGSDANNGSVGAPVSTIMRAQSLAASGDTVIINGGTYTVAPVIDSVQDGVWAVVNNINKNGITYEAAPGTRPVFDFSGVTDPGDRIVGFWVTASAVTFQGFDVIGIQETITGVNNQSVGMFGWGSKNCAWNQVNVHDGECVGIYFERASANNLVYQCDSYNNTGIDSFSYGNADGFGCHPSAGGTGNVFREDRSWNNSDDGYDCINSSEAVVFDHCWSYKNGNNGGNGNGFKVGGWASTAQDAIANPVPVHTVEYCLSACNSSHGFYANHQPGQAAVWTNNTSYNNSTDFDMLERTPPDYTSTVAETDANDIAGVDEVMHFNLAFAGPVTGDLNETGAMVSDNSWTEGIAVAAADFESTACSAMTVARNSDGSLPNITFMVPVCNSPVTGLGCFAAALCPGTNTPTSTPAAATQTPTGTPTRSMTPTASLTASRTSTSTSTATHTNSATSTATLTATATRTNTTTSTLTASASPTPTKTPTSSPSSTPTGSPFSTRTPTSTATLSATATSSFSPTGTPTSTVTLTLSMTMSPTPSPTDSMTPTASFTATASPSPTRTATFTATDSPTLSGTPTLTFTGTMSPTHTPTATGTFTSSFTATSTPTSTFTNMKTSTISSTPTFTLTASATSTGTPVNTITPTRTSTPAGTNGVVLFPNPAEGPGPVTLQITLSTAGKVQISVFTTAFRRVNEVTLPNVPAGTTDIALPLADQGGKPLANGLYYVVIQTPQGRFVIKLMVLR